MSTEVELSVVQFMFTETFSWSLDRFCKLVSSHIICIYINDIFWKNIYCIYI